jgi:hypothetical protein
MTITPAQIQDAITSVEYHLFQGTTAVACCLVLTNGHAVIGLAHCAKDTPFDPVLGQKYSREDAEAQVAELLAFEQRGPINPNERSANGHH